MTKCSHVDTKYVAEFDMGILFRDYFRCLTCSAEFSIVDGKWRHAATPQEPR